MSSAADFDPAAVSECETEPAEPCPTPLAWRAVVQAYLDQSRPWSLQRGGRVVDGRSWGDGPPLYLVGSVTTSHELFALTAYLLKDDYRCVVVDAPSVATPPSKPRATLNDFVGDLLAVADAEGDETFSLFGASWGGLLSVATAVRAPERVERMVLSGGSARWSLSWTERFLLSRLRRARRPLGQLPLWGEIQRRNHQPWFPPFDRSRWAFYVERTGEIPLKTVAARALSVVGADFRDQLAGVAQPTLLLRTEGDGAVRHALQEELNQGLPNAHTEWLQHTGRLLFLTHPHRLAKLIRGHLE